MALSTLPTVRGLRPGALVAAVVVLLGVSVSASAGNSNRAEMRGYDNCLAASSTQGLAGVTLPRFYYIAKRADSRVYYVNLSGWQDGVRVARRLTCETSRYGHKVYSVATADGRYARGTGRQTIVATR